MGSSYFQGLWLWAWVLLIVAVLMVMLRIGRAIWWRPNQIRKHLEAQGITGPPYKLLFGNLPEMKKMLQDAKSKPMELSHRIVPRVTPHYQPYSKYGRFFLHWFGPKPRLNIHDVDMIRDILSTKFGHFEKPPPTPLTNLLGGGSLANLEGDEWAKRRRIVNPAFHLEHLKDMIPTVAACTWEMFGRWKGKVEIEVSKEFRDLTADIIARTAFGSSYAEGKHIFEMLEEQTMLVIDASQSLYIPGFRDLILQKKRSFEKKLAIRRREVAEEDQEALEDGEAVEDPDGEVVDPEVLEDPDREGLAMDLAVSFSNVCISCAAVVCYKNAVIFAAHLSAALHDEHKPHTFLCAFDRI